MLPPIRHVLVPLDLGEDRNLIVQWGVDWARLHRARLVLLHVLPPLTAYPTPVLVDPVVSEDDLERAREAAKHALEPLAAYSRAMGIDTAIRVRMGNPAEEILEEAADGECGLIVLGTHGRRGLAHWVLGSTAERVVRLAECPVFVVKGAAKGAKAVGVGALAPDLPVQRVPVPK
jgi:nucleotide-binding universal stress UspA family protein